MGILTETLGTLIIASGQTISNTLGSVLSRGQLRAALGFLDNLTIISPQGIAEDIQVQVSPVRNPVATDWVTTGLIDITVSDELLDELDNPLLAENGDDLLAESSAWGGAVELDDLSFKDIRLKSDVPVAASRSFKLLAKLVTFSD